MASRRTHPNPFIAAAEQYGQRMIHDFITGGLPGVVDGVLEDVEHVAEEVTKRTKTARGKIAQRKRR